MQFLSIAAPKIIVSLMLEKAVDWLVGLQQWLRARALYTKHVNNGARSRPVLADMFLGNQHESGTVLVPDLVFLRLRTATTFTN